MKNRLIILASLVLGLGVTPQARAQSTRPLGSLLIESNAQDPVNAIAVWNFGTLVIENREVSRSEMAIKEAVIRIGNVTTTEMTNLVGSLLNPHFRFKNGAYPGEGGTCGKTLLPKTDCKLVITFAPQDVGAKRGVLRINYWEGTWKDHAPKTSYRPLLGEAQ